VKRGSIVAVALQGDFGKARTALVIQSDMFDQHPTVSILALSSEIVDAPLIRIDVSPTEPNGLHAVSQIAVDKIFTVSREKIGTLIGELEEDTLLAVNRALLVFLGIA